MHAKLMKISFEMNARECNMSKRTKKFAKAMKMLYKFNNIRRWQWLDRNIDDPFTICICECVLNIVNGNIPVNTKQRNALAKHKTALRKLIDRKVPNERKRR